MNAVK